MTFLGVALALLGSCSNTNNQALAMKKFSTDPHSFSKPNEVYVTHLDWNASVDFHNKVISAVATYSIVNQAEADSLFLDTDGLEIHRVVVDSNQEVSFRLHPEQEHLGRALAIPIEKNSHQVEIHYTTSPGASALLWVEPSGTVGKEHPFLFTQSQAILARSWVPCQDSPGIRFTYNARVKVPKGMMALMSAKNPQFLSEKGVYTFEMKQAIPSYLLALAVGQMNYQAIGPRTGVYAEPAMLEAAAYEFQETEDMLRAAETLYGPYAWERYDLLVLPPSFPFGGMENPRLTFVTPTILAGDRSLTSLVAHELAHSWSGNLVTNATWNDFWLNEGFTVYFERRIMEEVYGKPYAEMLALLGKQDLMRTLEDMKDQPADSHLKLDLDERNPDDGMNDIAYEKGYLLIRLLEETVGREAFDSFLLQYFNRFKFQVMDTESFLEYLNRELLNNDIALAEKLGIKQWVYGPGLPDNAPEIQSKAFDKVDKEIERFAKGKKAEDLKVKDWNSHQWLHFIRGLKGLNASKMQDLEATFAWSTSGNRELQCAWFEHVIAQKFEAAYKPLEQFLMEVGRRKFLMPLYRGLIDHGQKDWAKKVYQKARLGYHAVATESLDPLLLKH